MRLHLIDYAMWMSAPTLQSGVLVAMYRRRLYQYYPNFFNYTVLQTLSVPISMVWMHSASYYYAYLTGMALSTLLSFAVLQDLLKNGFQPAGTFTRLSSILLASTLVILVATEISATNTQSWGPLDTWTEVIYLTKRAVQFAQIGLVTLLFVLRKSLGISRRSMLFGITLGLGLFTTVNLLVVIQATHLGFVARSILSRINSAAYLLACGIWLAYALAGSGGDRGYCWKRVIPS